MNWKGYVQIIPTDEQVKRLEQAIKRADDFLMDGGEQESLLKKHFGRKSPLIIFAVVESKDLEKDA